ncbi:hypothetical protein ACIA98_43675 [Streptomyces sp. NPDC051366]|uniref:hypothetical protein n=1 Tax=Streptomyces sp. NPDC051366 TaxID=3365652 RepID=UPI0037B3ECC4
MRFTHPGRPDPALVPAGHQAAPPLRRLSTGQPSSRGVLDDFDLGAAGVGEADGLGPAFAGDVDSFSEDAYGGEERAMHAAAVGIGAVRELPDYLAVMVR